MPINQRNRRHITKLARMEQTREIDHASIQKVIIICLGLLMFNIILTSCKGSHEKCSAYDQIEINQNLPE